MSKRLTPPTRSLTEVPGWIKKTCERCEGDFWSVPSQAKFTRFCAKDCRHEPWEVRLQKNIIKGENPEDCWTFALAANNEGYPLLKRDGKEERVSRLVLEQHLGRPIAPGMNALHKCDNPRCVRVGSEHIYEGTQQENIQWCVESGRHVGNRILSDDQVREIRALKDKMGVDQVAALYGRPTATIYNIWLGYNRGNVSLDSPA